jgi:hypothetical protein
LGVLFTLKLAELGFGRGSGLEDAHQRPNAGPDARLGVGIKAELFGGVRLVDDGADGGPVVDRNFCALAAPSHRGGHGSGEEASLSGGGPVHGLQGDPGLGSDRRNGRTGIAVLEEDARGRVHHACTRGLGLVPTTCAVVPALGSCALRH